MPARARRAGASAGMAGISTGAKLARGGRCRGGGVVDWWYFSRIGHQEGSTVFLSTLYCS